MTYSVGWNCPLSLHIHILFFEILFDKMVLQVNINCNLKSFIAHHFFWKSFHSPTLKFSEVVSSPSPFPSSSLPGIVYDSSLNCYWLIGLHFYRGSDKLKISHFFYGGSPRPSHHSPGSSRLPPPPLNPKIAPLSLCIVFHQFIRSEIGSN